MTLGFEDKKVFINSRCNVKICAFCVNCISAPLSPLHHHNYSVCSSILQQQCNISLKWSAVWCTSVFAFFCPSVRLDVMQTEEFHSWLLLFSFEGPNPLNAWIYRSFFCRRRQKLFRSYSGLRYIECLLFSTALGAVL